MNDNGHIAQEVLSPWDDPMIAPEYDLEYLRQEAIGKGFDLSQAKYQNAIAQKKQKARAIVLRNAPNQPPAWFNTLRTVVQSFGNAILLVVMLVLSYVALPVAILGLAYAEIQRVSLGIGLFDKPRADLMATVSVSTYLILLVVQAATYHKQPDLVRPVWSLRLFLAQFGYVLGISRHWSLQTKTRTQMLAAAISRLGLLVILLGTAGSLETELKAASITTASLESGLSTVSRTWYEAIWHILTASDLITFLALAGGIALTAGLLAGMSFGVQLAFDTWVKLMPEQNPDFLSGSLDTSLAENQAEAMYLMSLINKAH